MNTNYSPAFIFDFGGVLMDWNPRYLYRKLFNGDPHAMERFFEEIDFNAWNLQQDAGRPFAEAVAELSGRFPHYASLIRAYDERWEESLAGPIWGTVDILRKLKEAGYPLYGLSNWSSEKHYLVRQKWGFFAWFDEIVISGDVRLVKPDPRIFTLLLERTGRQAGGCLLIDDSPVNINVAQELGFQTILYASPEQLETELKARGVSL